MARFLLVLLTVSLATGASATGDPIAKVLSMIGELQQKIIAEGETAQKTYAEFAEWCEDEAKNIRYEIKIAKAEVEDLKAVVKKSASDIEAEETKIEEISESITSDEADLKAATEIRQKEKKDFEAIEKDLMDDIDTLERAIMVLEKQMKGGASLAQLQTAASTVVKSLSLLVEASGIETKGTKRLKALLQTQHASEDTEESDDMEETEAPEKSEGIIETMNDLLEKAQSELAEAQKKEKKLQHNYEMIKMQLTDSINFGKKEMDKSKKGKAEAQEAKATAEGELSTTTKDLAGDTGTLASVHHDCMTKASDFESETQGRAEELKALATAKKVIQEATGGFLNQMNDSDQDASFLQVGSSMRVKQTMRAKQTSVSGTAAAKVIHRLAREIHSHALAQLASRMDAVVRMGARAGEDPFEKVKGLITTMIEKLMKEAEEEAGKKAYCDKEMGETEKKRDDMTDEIEDLTAKIDKMTAEAKKLKDEAAVLAGELADLAKSQEEMDKVRMEEHTEFVANKDEMEKGLKGIQMALKVLREYYAQKEGGASGGGAASGIIGLLEVVESDFSKGLEEIISAEETAASEYEKTTKANTITKTVKEQDVKYKSKDSKALSKAAAESTADREGVQTELDAVLEYYAKIKEECIAKADPYEEVKKRREQEIDGLKEALAILEGEAVFLQVKSTRHLRRHRSA